MRKNTLSKIQFLSKKYILKKLEKILPKYAHIGIRNNITLSKYAVIGFLCQNPFLDKIWRFGIVCKRERERATSGPQKKFCKVLVRRSYKDREEIHIISNSPSFSKLSSLQN